MRRAFQSGQSLILAVFGIAIASTTLALFILKLSGSTYETSIEHRRSIDVIYVLNAVARSLQYIYYYEANCDPYLFNNKINLFRNRIFNAPFAGRSLDMTYAARQFVISIGEMNPPPPTIQSVPPPAGVAAGGGAVPTYYTAGLGAFGPQDVSVTYWVTPFGQSLGSQGGVRYEQTVTLINTCTAGVGAGIPGPQFGSITNIALYQGAQPAGTDPAAAYIQGGNPWAGGPCGGSPRGGINNTSKVTAQDRNIFQNYLKNGDTSGVGIPLACMDMQNDGVINEIDMCIIEKALKGYINYLTPSWQ
jgi:hypothetical protein